jgi:mRNA interferase RelE/StbE
MNEYAITFARSARKELESLPASVIDRVWPRIESLSQMPRPNGCRKLSGERNLWRLRVGDYRIVYSVDEQRRIVDINAVRHRRDAYR